MSVNYKYLIVFIFFAAFIAVYFPSFSAPFYLDDFDSIVNNPIIKTLSWQSIDANYFMRELPYLSFALNYAWQGDEVFGFHLVNFILHLIMGLGVYLFTRKLIMQTGLPKSRCIMIAATTTALFLVAPLNTQAVTYVVQRIALMSAIFYVFALAFYLYARAAPSRRLSGFYYGLVLLCFIGGLHAKQNIVTLPVALVVMEYWLIRKKPQVLVNILAIVLLGMLGLAVLDYLFNNSGIIAWLDATTKEAGRLSRGQYFTHQLSALWIYFYKFFVPMPLLLEYGSTPYNWTEYTTWLALLGHVSVFIGAYIFRSRAPLVTLLIILFYITHSVESSIIPISDLMFEHRTYLPNVFVAIGITLGLLKLYERKQKVAIGLGMLIFVGFLILTYQRNVLWTKPTSFYRHELIYTTDSSRAYGAVGLLYAKAGNERKAERWFQMAVTVGAETQHLQVSTILQYMNSLYVAGKVGKANRIGSLALKTATRNSDKAQVLLTLAKIKAGQGLCDFAEGLQMRATSLDPSIKMDQQKCESTFELMPEN